MKAIVLAMGFALIGLYTTLDSLASTPPVGDVVVPRAVAIVEIVLLLAGAAVMGYGLLRERRRDLTRPMLVAWGIALGGSAALGFDPGLGGSVVALFAVGAVYHIALVRWYGDPRVARTVVGTFLALGIIATAAALAMQATRLPAALLA